MSSPRGTGVSNLFADVPADLPEELVEVLLESPALRVERIVSRGHATADGQWYDQETAELVFLLSGTAQLELEVREDPVELGAGDWLLIPAHRRHRVIATAADQDCVWLAIHVRDEAASPP